MAQERTPRAPKVNLDVTQDVIDNGVARDSSHCVLAEALKVAYPDAQRIAVDLQTIRFSDPKRGLRYTYLTPRAGQVYIVNFDAGHMPEPFTMQIRNGQVTRMAQAKPKRSPTTDPKLLATRQANMKKANAKLAKAKLVDRRRGTGDVPDRIGGKTPPLASYAHRRAYGLRALQA